MEKKKQRGADKDQRPASPDNEFPHELEFTTSVATWMTLIIEKDPSLPFTAARCESRSKGNQKRRDLSLFGRDGSPIITGEVKLPYQKDGATPYNAGVVKDARQKAERARVPYFFTWNVNECVLWKTDSTSADPMSGQQYRSWKVVTVTKDTHLVAPSTTEAIKRWLGTFLNDVAKIIAGNIQVGIKAPDERFIAALESALTLPIRFAFEALEPQYRTARGKDGLDKWMRDEQGWTITDDPTGVIDNLERAAKFSCYAQVNRLVFYEALMKRYGAQLPKLNVPDHIDSGDDLRMHLEGFFAEAKTVTGDYETVFGEDRTSLGSRIPFYSDFAVPYWRGLINQIHEFDFSKLDYEVIGGIFERLISPEERHKFGQFYTRAEVVDLINSFCIRSGEEAVMDPACGGGTFLVRAYARKRVLAPQRTHVAMLDDLYGIDISPFATHLTTINLATRDLIQDENYPRIARSSFFDVRARAPFISLPVRLKSKGLGKIQHRDVQIPALDAVVANPPYIRQEEIKGDKLKGAGHPRHGTKEFYRRLALEEMAADLSGRSDLHCYFWPHAASFLKPDGWLCLLTSSQWLDVEYGFRLQAWILSHFKILAIIESIDEPWFVGARVATAITILQRCNSVEERAENLVRFVQLRRPIAEILSHDGTTAGAVRSADEFRDELLTLATSNVDQRYRARLILQRTLLEEGVALGNLMRGSAHSEGEDGNDGEDTDTDTDTDTQSVPGRYYGGKWGIFIRAPDLWFDLLERYGDLFAPLGEIADVRFGVKSGKDAFFFPRDVSSDCLREISEPALFQDEFGVRRDLVESGTLKLVRCGEKQGEIRAIESEYLESEVHSLMEVDGYTVGHEQCGRMILLVGRTKDQLRGTHVLNYIRWGESKGWHKAATCAARATEEQAWYDLTNLQRPDIILPKIQQYRLMTFLNPERLYQNSSLLGLYDAPSNLVRPLCAVLNSTIAVMSRLVYARILGNEGNIQLDVYSAKMMLVPNITRCSNTSLLAKIDGAFGRMVGRKALGFLSERRMRQMTFTKAGRESDLNELSDLSELDMRDRRELDLAVLDMIGVASGKERESVLDKLYQYLRGSFEQVRQKEEKAIENKNKSKRQSPHAPGEVATQIYAVLKDKYGHLLHPYSAYIDRDKAFSTFDLPSTGVPELHKDMFTEHGSVRFMKGRRQLAIISTKTPTQAELIAFIASHGVRGIVRVPLDVEECQRVLVRYEGVQNERERRIRELIADRTADADMQETIFAATTELMLQDAA